MHPAFASVSAPHPDCRTIVTIPARDESALIARTLDAFGRQRTIDGSSLSRGQFEIVVFANACTDDTAARARAAALRHAHLRIHVVEAGLPPDAAHVGSARKLVMDFAAQRLMERGTPRALIASLDADTVVEPTWVAWLERESANVEAVAGYVTICEVEQAKMLAPVRLLYARELAFRRAVAELEASIDPRPEDPAPRHASFVGASFGVAAGTYRAAGGIPALSRLEDFAFAAALRRIDARIRHSVRVRATTSARVRPRVEGGFGSFMAHLVEQGRRRDTFNVEPAAYWLDTFASRAALRRIWHDAHTASDIDLVTNVFGLAPDLWRPLVERGVPFGTIVARIEERAAPLRRRYAPVPVEDAVAELRAAAASRNAAPPTRTSAASGAG